MIDFRSIVLLLLASALPASAGVSVVRVSSPSPFPIGDCQPDDYTVWNLANGNDGAGEETDPSVAINPTNPLNVVAAWPADRAYGIVAASSFDGGQTWTRTGVPGLTVCTGGTENHMLHARLTFGGDGRLYLSGETLHGFFPDPRSGINHVPVVTSVDGGLTWSARSLVDDLPAASGFDRIMAEPDVPGAAVVVWHGPEGAATSYLSRTTDGGATWVKRRLPFAAPELQPFQSVLAAPDGNLYAFAADHTLEATVELLENFVGGLFGFEAPLRFPTNLLVTRSEDKGESWSEPVTILMGVPAVWVATAAGPGGTVYVSTWRDGASGRELIVTRSADGGATWSAPSIIASGVLAPFPVLAARPDGTLGVTYMTPAASGTKAVFAHSGDGGATWSRLDVAGPFPPGAYGFYQETAAGPDDFASIFIRGGSDSDGPTDAYVAKISTEDTP
jgi:hypothetical protein